MKAAQKLQIAYKIQHVFLHNGNDNGKDADDDW